MLVTSTIQTRPREILPTSQGRDAAAEEQQGAEAESGGSAAARMPVRGAEGGRSRMSWFGRQLWAAEFTMKDQSDREYRGRVKNAAVKKKLANSTAVPHRMRERVGFSLSGFVSNFLSLHVGHQRVLCEMGE